MAARSVFASPFGETSASNSQSVLDTGATSVLDSMVSLIASDTDSFAASFLLSQQVRKNEKKIRPILEMLRVFELMEIIIKCKLVVMVFQFSGKGIP